MQYFSQAANVFSIALLPFGTIQIVQNTQAFWTILFGFFINREEFLKIELIGILACFCGVLLMVQADVDPDN